MTFKEKVPINFVVCFFEVQLQNHPNFLLKVCVVQDLMEGEDPIHDVSVFDEGILLFANQFVSKHRHSIIQHFGNEFVRAPQQTDRPKFLDIFGPIDFRN